MSNLGLLRRSKQAHGRTQKHGQKHYFMKHFTHRSAFIHRAVLFSGPLPLAEKDDKRNSTTFKKTGKEKNPKLLNRAKLKHLVINAVEAVP